MVSSLQSILKTCARQLESSYSIVFCMPLFCSMPNYHVSCIIYHSVFIYIVWIVLWTYLFSIFSSILGYTYLKCFLLPSTEMNYLKVFYFYIIFLSISKIHDILYELVVTPPVSNVISLHSWSQAQMKEEGYCR